MRVSSTASVSIAALEELARLLVETREMDAAPVPVDAGTHGANQIERKGAPTAAGGERSTGSAVGEPPGGVSERGARVARETAEKRGHRRGGRR